MEPHLPNRQTTLSLLMTKSTSKNWYGLFKSASSKDEQKLLSDSKTAYFALVLTKIMILFPHLCSPTELSCKLLLIMMSERICLLGDSNQALENDALSQ